MDKILGCYVMGFTYLASPFEHKNPDVMEARCESVRLITSSLVAKGDVVFSPIAYTENSELPEPPQGWLKFDLAMLQCADLLLIACMPGHQDSAGIKQEIEFAASFSPYYLILVEYCYFWLFTFFIFKS